MSFEPVDVFVKDSTPLQNPVEGVLVKVYNQAGSVFFTQATTDALGKASFLLETLAYSLRFNKFQIGFTQPQILTVLTAPATNVFDVAADVFEFPIATDARLCRCSGFFRDVSGSVKPYLDIHFIAKFDPILLEGSAIVTERQTIRTDKNGFASIDLIRGAQYSVTIQEFEDRLREISIPDASSANLPDVLFAVADEVSLTPAGPYSLAVGESLELIPVVIASSGLELTGAATADVQWRSSDDTILAVTVTTDTVTIRGNAPGSANITVERTDQTIIRIPDTPIQGQPIAVTVT